MSLAGMAIPVCSRPGHWLQLHGTKEKCKTKQRAGGHHKIMKRAELSARLRSEEIPESCYCLEGGLPNDRFVLHQEGHLWEVYYTERGAIYEKKSFTDEDAACDYLYSRVKKMMEVL